MITDNSDRVRVGTDLMAVADVDRAIQAFGDRYLQRVYHPVELAECALADGRPDASRLAARFAAKESVVKALRIADGVDLRDIVVARGADGGPVVQLHGGAAAAAQSTGLRSHAVSLTHEGAYAAATFVAMVTTGGFDGSTT
jgi:holo-[acyl-carrier protein] synthase